MSSSTAAAAPRPVVPARVPSPGREPAAAHEHEALARVILQRVFRRRRLLPDALAAAATPDPRRHAPHLPRLTRQLAEGRPLQFVLPAFPAKSPNRRKTLGPLPDLGERLALESLQQLCDEIGELWSPGARITICSDGRVFGRVVGVSDDDVSAYRTALATLVREQRLDAIEWFGLEDVWGGDDYDAMRDELLVLHARPIARIRDTMREDAQARALFNGIHRFMLEDLEAAAPLHSRTACREAAKRAAYRVIQRSNAWSALVAERFPQALRLSIHPQPDVSDKIGIALLPTADPWVTPWHAVALHDGRGWRLVKRSTAEAMEAELVAPPGGLPYYRLPATAGGAAAAIAVRARELAA